MYIRILTALTAFCLIICLPAAQTAAQSERVCQACGEAIAGGYFETGSYFYHPEHFTCAHCKQPIKERYTVYKGHNYHTACFQQHVALRCAVCDGIIQGQYILDHWGNGYHLRHQGEVTQCTFCQRFIVGSLADGMVRFDDGRFLCGICSATMVVRHGEARVLMEQVAKMLRPYGLKVDTERIELHLIDRREMRELSPVRSGHTTGFTDIQSTRNLFGWVRVRRIQIYVVGGVPRTDMMATLAHELTHVWQFYNAHPKMDRAVSEGSCNYASYLVLRKLGDSEADYLIESMLKNQDPVYGRGFRRVKIYSELHGLAAWLRLQRKRDVTISAFGEG